MAVERKGRTSVKQRIMLVVVIALNGTTVALAQLRTDGKRAWMTHFSFARTPSLTVNEYFSVLPPTRI